MDIIEEIGLAAVYEQTAEECVELAHAYQKMARVLRGVNPTPVTYEQAMEQIREEYIDVLLCQDLLDIYPNVVLPPERFIEDYNSKKNRWKERIIEMKEKKKKEKGE